MERKIAARSNKITILNLNNLAILFLTCFAAACSDSEPCPIPKHATYHTYSLQVEADSLTSIDVFQDGTPIQTLSGSFSKTKYLIKLDTTYNHPYSLNFKLILNTLSASTLTTADAQLLVDNEIVSSAQVQSLGNTIINLKAKGD
jgi:hypothetical protein